MKLGKINQFEVLTVCQVFDILENQTETFCP